VTTQRSELRVEPAVSAGGVVYREGDHGPEFLLCGRSMEGLWAIPKGTPEPGESLEEAARREVSEETGIGVRIVRPLGTISYEFSRPSRGVRYEKTVHHYLMTPDGTGSTDAHDQEYDRVQWFHAEEAMRLITHRNEAAVLRRALHALREGGA
jgi:8-oxo-dGTP pyrophosphatase MutT (NUDIX family)